MKNLSSNKASLIQMDYIIPLLLAFSCLLCLYILRLWWSSNRKPSKLPPGPNPLPIIGNLFHLSSHPHHSLTNLSKIYGPLMTLKLGCITTIVVSSVDIAREIFQVHDKAFSGKKVSDAARALDHHIYSIGWLPASSQWRNLRKIYAIQLFTKHRLDATRTLREKKVVELLEYVGECCEDGLAVDIGRAVFTTTLNLLSSTFFSIDLAGYSSTSSQEFKDISHSIMEVLGKPNLVDFFPILSYLDPFGIRRRAEGCFAKMFVVFDDIIRERLSAESLLLSAKDDVLGALLLKTSKENGSGLSLVEIKHLLFDLFVAGTDTTSSTIEWAMTELIRDPTKLVKAQDEMDQVLGKDGLLIQEPDITRLPYLQAVVKETLRLYPPAPLLLPHKSENQVNLCGYVVPKDSQLLVNVWAMGRDPSIWENPELFHPDRFMGSEIDVRGQDFELIPFGAGRRICPGLPLAHRMLHVMLVNLIRSFDWKLEGGIRREGINMNDSFGITLHKAIPLLAVPLAK